MTAGAHVQEICREKWVESVSTFMYRGEALLDVCMVLVANLILSHLHIHSVFHDGTPRQAEMGGFKEYVMEIQGERVYSKLKYESGVHRVQRVPATESSGRVHTSTATVAIMPEVRFPSFIPCQSLARVVFTHVVASL